MTQGGVEAVMAQGRDKGLGPPVAERRVIDKALAARRPTGGLGHVGFDRGLVYERQPFQMSGHEGLTFRDPDAPQIGHILALLLKRLQVFFVRQPEAVQDPPDGAAVGIDAIGPGELRGQPIKRNLAPGGDAGFDPVCHTGSLPRPPPLPCRRGASDSVSRRNLTRSLTNFGKTRKCRAAVRFPCPSSTYAMTRVRSSIGCGLPIGDPHMRRRPTG